MLIFYGLVNLVDYYEGSDNYEHNKNTPHIAEILCVKNVRAIVISGLLIR